LGQPSQTLPPMLYAAKCFWPGVTEETLRLAIGRAGDQSRTRPPAVFRAALYLPSDDLVLCVFESASREGVKRASEQAGMPCERVIETVWVAPAEKGGGSQ
jgi:hypothetical protein